MAMVKLIVLDVDGVIVGHKIGVNFPYPNKKVISRLKEIRQSGIPIVLCSGKSRWPIEPIILKANLNNPHITDGGGLIIDPVAKKIIRSFSIEKDVVLDFINTSVENKIFIEAFSADDYFIPKYSPSEQVSQRTLIMQRQPKIVDSIADEASKHEIIRLQPIIFNKQDKEKIEKLFSHLKGRLKFIWTMHPSTKPWEYYLATAPDASKANAVKEVAKSLNISLDDALGVGDTMGDWEFMKFCGHTAAMGNAPDELKKLSQFTAPSVDDDGILEVFRTMLE